MDQAYVEMKRAKLLKNAERGLLLARAKLQNRLVVMVDDEGKTELTFDQGVRPESDNRRCIRLNTGNEPNAIGYSTPISKVLELLEAGRPKLAAGELEGIFSDIHTQLSSSATSIQFLRMAKKNLNLLCELEQNFAEQKQTDDRKLYGLEDPLVFEKMSQ
ncbi:uncharacterized protein LOC106664806 [Cimex lectularius]|uniref:Uncharacterized protein n=1 Tax=Cimex lectularius TaxID=79782 RepID=A0A8I6TFE3_CIMLE|nr:uncharacterized protein LOC106664806 [Cimex lectularius]